MQKSRRVSALAVLLFFSCLALLAQITGELRGTVSDPTGAAIPKATVTLTNLETRQVRTQSASSEGEFSFNLLSIGGYEVEVAAPGFSTEKAEAQVKTGETSSVAFRLTVGQKTEAVQVSDAVSQVDAENSQLQTSFTGQAIQEIPVGRNANLFVLSVPGVAPVSPNNPAFGSGSFNANGGRGRGNNIMVDGITATDVSTTGTGNVTGPLNFSSIKEVKIITNDFNAEYGRNSSSQVLYITKGGTNEFHGEMYDYLQNDKLNARAFFDRTGKPVVVRQNQYGFEVGGPVFIPKLFNGRNKLFWHVDYEGLKRRGVSAPVIANLPTPAQLASITDPTSLAIANQYKLPSSPTGTAPYSAPNTTDTWEVAERGDVILGKKDTLWARYGVYDTFTNSAGNTFLTSNLPYFGAANANHPREASLAETHVFGSTMVNEFRFGFGQSNPSFPIQTPYPLGPAIAFADGSVTGLGVTSIFPQGREQRTCQYTDNFTITRGSHNIKAGFEWYHLAADSFFDNNVRSTLTFANFAAFAAGQPSNYAQDFGNSVRDNRVENAFAFLQDDWRVAHNLTLNHRRAPGIRRRPDGSERLDLQPQSQQPYGIRRGGRGTAWIARSRQTVVQQQLQSGPPNRLRLSAFRRSENRYSRRLRHRLRFRFPEPHHQPALSAAADLYRFAARRREFYGREQLCQLLRRNRGASDLDCSSDRLAEPHHEELRRDQPGNRPESGQSTSPAVESRRRARS